MKSIVKFSGYSALAMFVLFAFSYFFLSGLSFTAQEVFGYLSILVSLSFVFFGVRSYRNNEKQGSISFFKALGIGLVITLVPSILFGVYNVIYVEYIDPGSVDAYYAAMIEQTKLDYTGEALTAKLAEMEEMKTSFSSPWFGFIIMFLTVFLIGIVVSVISAVALRKK